MNIISPANIIPNRIRSAFMLIYIIYFSFLRSIPHIVTYYKMFRKNFGITIAYV